MVLVVIVYACNGLPQPGIFAIATQTELRSLIVETALVFTSDHYRGLPLSSPPCTFTIRSSTGTDLLVSVTTSSSISLRRPLSSRDLVIRDEQRVFIANRDPKTYRLFSSPITVEMPLSLSFRAVVVVSAVAECDQHTFRCGNPCDFGVSQKVEDRTVRAPKEEICRLPTYQSELYSRRQSLPVPPTAIRSGRLKWKRTSVGAK
ncbi:hypothetical protein RB195_013468 [Necator americanus]|uniref:CUB domain-containing protein n=1 Tax=Necator americanus TaxID=51031 RepID=A0ABR1DYD2_NECAM